MVWVIVITLLLVAFGPILWMLPTRADRRLARMRKRARQHGLAVDIVPLKKRDATAAERVSAGGVRRSPTTSSAAYRKPLLRPARHLASWKIDRGDDADASPVANWVWDERADSFGADYWQRVRDLVTRVPRDALAIGATSRDVSIYWLETAPDAEAEQAVDHVDTLLQELAQIHGEENDRIEARREREKFGE